MVWNQATQTSGGGFGYGANATAIGGPSTGNDTGTPGAGGGYWGGNVSTSIEHNPGHHAATGGSCYISGYSGCRAVKNSSTQSNISFETHANHYSGLKFDSGAEMYDGGGYKWGSTAATSTCGFKHPTTGNTENGHYGNGYCRITLISID